MRGLRRAVVTPGPADVTHGTLTQWRGMATLRFPCQGAMRRPPGCRAGARSFGRRRQWVREAGTAGHRRRWARISSRVWGCGRTKGAPTRDRQRYEWRLHTGMQAQNGPHDRCWHNAPPPNARRNRVPAKGLRRGTSAGARARLCRFRAGRGSRGDVRQQLTSHHTAASGARRTATRGCGPRGGDEPRVLGAAQTARLLRHEPDHQAAAIAPATHHALRVSSMAHPPWRNRLITPMLLLRCSSACKDTMPAGRHAPPLHSRPSRGDRRPAHIRETDRGRRHTARQQENPRPLAQLESALPWSLLCCGPGQGTPTLRSTSAPAGAPPGHGRSEWRPAHSVRAATVPRLPSALTGSCDLSTARASARSLSRAHAGHVGARRSPRTTGADLTTHHTLTLPARPRGNTEVTWVVATAATSAAPTRLAAFDHEAAGVTHKHLWQRPARRAPGWTAHRVRTGQSPTSPMKSPVLGAA